MTKEEKKEEIESLSVFQTLLYKLIYPEYWDYLTNGKGDYE